MKRGVDLSPELLYSEGYKRIQVSTDGNGMAFSPTMFDETAPKKAMTNSKVIGFSDPLSVRNLLDGLQSGKFGSVTKDIQELLARRSQFPSPYFEDKSQVKQVSKLENRKIAHLAREIVYIDLEDDSVADENQKTPLPVITVDSDEEDREDQMPSSPSKNAVLNRPAGEAFAKDTGVRDHEDSRTCVEDANLYGEINSDGKDLGDQKPSCENVVVNQTSAEILVKDAGFGDHADGRTFVEDGDEGNHQTSNEDDRLEDVKRSDSKTCLKDVSLCGEIDYEIKKDKGVYVGIEDDDDYQTSTEDDGLEEFWNELSMGLELSKDVAVDHSSDEQEIEDKENCGHSFVLKDDLGYVCRVCGVIGRGIETIFEFQYNKGKRSTRTYIPESRNVKDKSTGIVGLDLSGDDLMSTQIYAHTPHMEQMKPHQVEGFNFLVSNLMGDNPGGCILAHAPGSGKTFMMISFMQSFLAKYPDARPLVILPKGILDTWKKEFQTWKIEDIQLYDFYASKADNPSQKLEVLEQWVKNKGVLFLGYQQFSRTICDMENTEQSVSCRNILLKFPTLLILDEGHTPRNESTNILQSLARVQTPRKVVLSGTLYQNHVKEVFNILNLVRPRFLKVETSRLIVKRILSKLDMSGVKKHFNDDGAFYDRLEETLQKDEDFRRKVTVIQDLREMTNKVLHYYKGDFLDELPGLADFTLLLNLSSKQKLEAEKIKFQGRFQASVAGSAVYLHPKLQSFSQDWSADDKMDEMLKNLDVKDGVKAKFFLNMLSFCESRKEKLLVFSQYLRPLKFLERLAMKTKGWCLGREIFVILGKSNYNERKCSIEQFNNSPYAKVFFGSIKACGEGISLVGASRIIVLDVHLNPSVTRQAIGRAFRPGQGKKVFVYRLVAADSPEEEDHNTCFKKELISKMWFEWNEHCGYRDFELQTVDVHDCGDLFLESSLVPAEDVKVLYRRKILL